MVLRQVPITSVFALVLIAGCDGGGSTGATTSGGSGGGSGSTASSGGATSTESSGGTSVQGSGASGGMGGTGGQGGTGPGGQGGGAPNVCGDGVAMDEEECDGADLKGADCTLFGFSKKAGVACSPGCTFDITGCVPTCDGALLEPGEECDGAHLGDHDCTELGFSSKPGAKCNATCSGIVVGNCKPTCNGALLEPGEACDGANLAGQSCQDYGFDNPAGLACGVGCTFDSSGCVPSCNGGGLEPGEACDGADLGGKSCQDFGYASPLGLACSAACSHDTSGCVAVCGNGVKEPGEGCDGAPIAGQLCVGCQVKYTTVINEVWYDPPGTDSTSGACFIELFGDPSVDLSGYALKFIDGGDGSEYIAELKLTGQSIGQTGYFVVVQTAAQLAALPAGTNGLQSSKADLQNGPDNLVLVKDGMVVDAIGYGTFMGVFAGEGSPAQDPSNAAQTLSRLPNGSDTNDNGVDFKLGTPTPGSGNLP